LNYTVADPRDLLFGPQGRTVLIASAEPAIDVIGLDPDDITTRLCQGAGPPITDQQWQQVLPGYQQHPGCR